MIGDADETYIRSDFRELDALAASAGRDLAEVRELIAAGRLPRPTYVLDDGSEWVPPDYFSLLDEAGDADAVRALFMQRLRNAAHADLAEEEVEEEWEGYISGEYGACLKDVTPELIVRKSALMEEIERLLEDPRPHDTEWPQLLRDAVEALDAIERPFAEYDRERFGGPVSRDRLITEPRARFPDAFISESP